MEWNGRHLSLRKLAFVQGLLLRICGSHSAHLTPVALCSVVLTKAKCHVTFTVALWGVSLQHVDMRGIAFSLQREGRGGVKQVKSNSRGKLPKWSYFLRRVPTYGACLP